MQRVYFKISTFFFNPFPEEPPNPRKNTGKTALYDLLRHLCTSRLNWGFQVNIVWPQINKRPDRNICHSKQKLQQTKQVNRGEPNNTEIRRWEQRIALNKSHTEQKQKWTKQQAEAERKQRSKEESFWFKRRDKWDEIDSGFEGREGEKLERCVPQHYCLKLHRTRSLLAPWYNSIAAGRLFVSP